MSPEDAILTIALFAAFADDVNDERELEHIRQTRNPPAPNHMISRGSIRTHCSIASSWPTRIVEAADVPSAEAPPIIA
jgi:hypothetical protein